MAYCIPETAGIMDMKYLNEQLTAVCKIQIQDKGKATGFIGHLQQNDQYLLITNHHVLQKHRDDPKRIKIIFKHAELMGSELFANDQWFSDSETNLVDNTKYGLDYTIIPVKKEKLDKITPFDLTETDLNENDILIVAGHPVINGEQQDLQLSIERRKNLVGFLVYYGCATFKGSSGSPVLKVVNGKLRVVVLHRACQEKYLNYGSLFSAVLGHAFKGGDCPETKVLMVKKFLEKVKWKPLKPADLYRLLQPVESSWKELGRCILKEDVRYKIKTFDSDSNFKNYGKKALDDVMEEWLRITTEERNWKTLCNAAKKYKDGSLEDYVTVNALESNNEPTLRHLQRWSKNSTLRTSWYNFSVELIGMNKTDDIKEKHYGGGSHSCLQRVLSTWLTSTPDHDWQIIIDALEELDEFSLIQAIENYCLEW